MYTPRYGVLKKNGSRDQLSLFIEQFGPPCVVDLVPSVYQLLTSDVSGFVQQGTGTSGVVVCQEGEEASQQTLERSVLVWLQGRACKNGTFEGKQYSPLFTLVATFKHQSWKFMFSLFFNTLRFST